MFPSGSEFTVWATVPATRQTQRRRPLEIVRWSSKMIGPWSTVASLQSCPGWSSSSSSPSLSSPPSFHSFNFLPAAPPPPQRRLLRGWTAACWASPGRATPCCWSRGRCPEMFRRLLRGSSQQMVNGRPVQFNLTKNSLTRPIQLHSYTPTPPKAPSESLISSFILAIRSLQRDIFSKWKSCTLI